MARADAAGVDFLFVAAPRLAEICLVPQMCNARRFGVGLALFSRLVGAGDRCVCAMRILIGLRRIDPIAMMQRWPFAVDREKLAHLRRCKINRTVRSFYS